MISASCERDVTTLKASRHQAAMTSPRRPVGFRKAETQTFVSSRATSGTAFRLDLIPCLGHLCLDHLLWDRFGAKLHPMKQAFKSFPPSWLWAQGNQDTGLLFQSKWLQRSQHSVFIHRPERFFAWRVSSRQCHKIHYNDASALWQAESAQFPHVRATKRAGEMDRINLKTLKQMRLTIRSCGRKR